MSSDNPTARLAEFISTTSIEQISEEVLHEAKRTLINIVAVALSAWPPLQPQPWQDPPSSPGRSC